MMASKKHNKLQTYRLKLPGLSVGSERKDNDCCDHCKVMGQDSKRPLKECVVVERLWNGACSNCYHYCRVIDCSRYDQSKRPKYERDANGCMRQVIKRGY